jgi:hypothetical protein
VTKMWKAETESAAVRVDVRKISPVSTPVQRRNLEIAIYQT